MITGRLTRAAIPRRNDYQQAADRWLTMEDWEREDLERKLSTALGACERPVQARMVWHLHLIDDDLAAQVGGAIGVSAKDVTNLEPLPGQVLTDEAERRRRSLGSSGARRPTTTTVTGSVPNRRADVPEHGKPERVLTHA